MQSRLLALAASSLLAIGWAGCGCQDWSIPAPFESASPPPPPADAQSSVRRIHSRSDVRLKGFAVEAKGDDFLIEGSGLLAVVSAKKGKVIDFGAPDQDDALVSIEPTVFVALDEPKTVVESVEPASGGRSLLIRRKILVDPPLVLSTYVDITDGALRLHSTAAAPGDSVMAATLGEIVAWGNEPTWIEGHGFASADGSFTGDFIAREALGVAYALARPSGHALARFRKAQEFGFHEWPRTGELVESISAHGKSKERVITVSYAHGSMGDAVLRLPRFAHAAHARFTLPDGLPKDTYAEVAHCDDTPFERIAANRGQIELPRGCWRVRFSSPGYAPGAWVSTDALPRAGDDMLPHAGTLRWKIREQGSADVALPARILLRGQADTADPDWGEGPNEGASGNVLYVDRDGERPIPPGHYRVNVTRGFEYTTLDSTIDVVQGRVSEVDAELARVVDTTGWVSADLHVHAIPSFDAPTPLDDRVRALAAAGVEVAVATDHNVVTDYTATIRERGLGRFLSSMIGDEVTTRGVLMGHFNVFPLAAGSEPVPYERMTPTALLDAMRKSPPGGPRVAQMNHPRMGSIGYLELLRFDTRDVRGWRANTPLGELGFDAIEVFNGADYADLENVERCLRDWYALLDAGIRMTATGNSDSHKITYQEAGIPRNFVQMPNDAPERLDPARFIDAIRQGRVVVSSGPFLRLTVDGRGIGETAAPGEREVVVGVDAAPWVDVETVDIVRHGKVLRSFAVPPSTAVHRFDTRFKETFAHGDWVIAVARGRRPMDFLYGKPALPFAFTNPVWVR